MFAHLKNILPFFPLIILPTVIIFFVLAIKKSRSLDPIEKGLIPVMKITCAGIIGRLAYRGPFIQIRIYEKFIVVGYMRKKIVLRYDEIQSIENVKQVFVSGMQIIHNNLNHPKKIILFISDINNVKNYIETRIGKF